MANSNK